MKESEQDGGRWSRGHQHEYCRFNSSHPDTHCNEAENLGKKAGLDIGVGGELVSEMVQGVELRGDSGAFELGLCGVTATTFLM